MAALEEHERRFGELLARCAEASRSPQPGAMIHVRFAAQLARLQAETAKALGLAATDEALAARFSGEEAKLKEICGL